MNGRQLGTGLMLAGTLLVDSPATGAQIDRPELVIRAYFATPVRTADWRDTTRQVSAILDEAGIPVGWTNCAAGVALAADGQPERCTAPLASNEVAVRIVRSRTQPSRAARPLGESLLDTTRGTGTLATIYLDRVEWLAAAGGTSISTVLARAIAHEVGHLLLGTATHSERGLMRAVWTRDEMLRERSGDWTFPIDDAVRLRRGFERRIAPLPVPALTIASSAH